MPETVLSSKSLSLRWIAILSVGYIALGWVGLRLAIPPGYASPVFPAAGLALAMVLARGYRMLPGVWLGSFTLNLLHSSHGPEFNWIPVAAAALIAFGATAQAAVGASLVERRQGAQWRQLEREQDAFVFMVQGGLLAGLASASISVASLVSLGVISPSQAGFTWWNWYTGDALGVMIFAPLSLCFLMGGALWRQRRRRVVAPMLLTLAIAGAVFYAASRSEYNAEARRLEDDGQQLADRISDHLMRHREVLASMRNFVVATPEFSFPQFERFTQYALKENPDLSALSYNDLVEEPDRGAYEKRAGKLTSLPGFRITARNAEGRLVRAGEASQHVVVRFIVPLDKNLPAVGYDIYSDPVRRQAIQSALERGEISITEPLWLVQDHRRRIGLLELYPVYRANGDTPEPRTTPLGFAVGVLKVDQLIEIALKGVVPAGLHVQIRDVHAPASNSLLYRSDANALVVAPFGKQDIAWSKTIGAADRTWELALVPTREYGEQGRRWFAWAVGVAGLLFASLLQVLMLGMTGRAAVVQRKNDELRDSERRYLQLFNENPLAAWLVDTSTRRFLLVNDRAVAHYGWPREEWLQMRLDDIVLADRIGDGNEQQHRRSDGSRIDVRVNSSPATYGDIDARLDVVEDVTQEKQIQSKLLLADKALASSSDGIVVIDTRGVVASVNPAFTRITGYDSDEIVGAHASLLNSERQSPAFYRQMWRSIVRDRQWQGELWSRRKDGEEFLERLNVSAVFDDAGKVSHYLGTFTDITAQKQARERIDFLAFHDALTHLPNRVLGQDRLKQAVIAGARHHRKFAVLYMDLDKFKYVNDTHGHSVGDALLQAVSQRLIHLLRTEDLLCRLSGDEFMIVLHEVEDQQHVVSVCEKILSRLVEPFDLEGLRLHTSFSIGVAMFPQDGADAGTLMRNADTAMYEAKLDGRNIYRFFDPQMNAAMLRYVQTRDALRLALERKEFELHYQPQIEFLTGRVVGAEALVRWNRPDRGLMLPAEFISAAEESGLIVPLGKWVLQEACAQAATWRAAGWAEAVVAVNLSGAQFRQGHLEETIFAALRESGLEPCGLELELTESILLGDVDAVMNSIRRLKAHGLRLSIDDFGTGYSSLSYLKRFRVDKLKIDQSFVRDILQDDEDRAIVQAVVQMARSLNLRTIAEGVEDAERARVLEELGCDEGQGFVFTKALPAKEFEQWLERHRAITS